MILRISYVARGGSVKGERRTGVKHCRYSNPRKMGGALHGEGKMDRRLRSL